MKRNEIISEHKKGRRAVIYNKKPKTHSEPPKPTNPVAKNANAAIGGGAAGPMKDKKQATTQVRGQKHKKQPELAEGRRDFGYDDAGYSLAPGHDEGEPVYSRAHDRIGDGGPRPHREPAGDVPHAVHIDGKKWKTFGSRSHAVNVARKLQGNGKNATVEKDIDEDTQLTVAKDDDKSTELLDKNTGVTQTIDKSNPNAPRLAQDPTGKLMLTKPGGQDTGAEAPPNYAGKTVTVTPEATVNVAATGSQPGDEEDSINTKGVLEDNAILAMIRGIR